MMLTDLEILTQARDLLSNPARWTQHKFAGDERDIEVDVYSPDAVCFCVIGACHKVSGNCFDHPSSLRRAAEELGTYPDWINDTLGYEATLRLLDTAIEIERAL